MRWGRVRIVDLKTGLSKPSVAEVDVIPSWGPTSGKVDAGGFGPGVAKAPVRAPCNGARAAKSTTDLQVQRALRAR